MAAKKQAKKKEPAEIKGINDEFEAQLEELGLGSALKLADDVDNDVKVLTTGFPGLDHAIDDKGVNSGFPIARHVEIYSKKEHSGKTTLALAIGVTWQLQGKRVIIIDIEGSVTKSYLKTLGYIVDKAEAEGRGLYAVRLLQVTVKPEEFETDMLYAEHVLDIVGKASNVFDYVVVDSVDALVSETESVKSAEENEKVGGIAKKMRGFFRKNTSRRATTLWLNHANQNIGGTMISYSTSGGKSVPRYSSLRLELSVMEKLKENKDASPYGFITRVLVVKNRLGANWRYVDLYYIWGEGFSKLYDYFMQAVKLGILFKAGAYYYILGEGKNVEERKKKCIWKCQGELNTYRALTGKDPDRTEDQKLSDAEAWKHVLSMIDGESVDVGVEFGDDDAVAAAETHEEADELIA